MSNQLGTATDVDRASPRTAQFWKTYLLALPSRSIQAACGWAMILLLFHAINHDVGDDAVAQFRWVVIAGVITAAVGNIPIRGWRASPKR